MRLSRGSIAIVGAGMGGLAAAAPAMVGLIVTSQGVASVFLMFAGISVIGALTATRMLETQNRSLEDIAQ